MAIVKLMNVRLSFPKLFKAEVIGKDADKRYYSCACPIVPGSENHKALDAAILEAAKTKWPDKWVAILKVIRSKDDISFHEKELVNSEGEVYDGFQSMHNLNASRNEEKGPPMVVDRGNRLLSATSGKPYAGCWVNLSVEIWAQDNANGKRINATLRTVQFVRDGDSFGGGAPLSGDEFDALPEDADELFG
jgi:hypothetical protein